MPRRSRNEERMNAPMEEMEHEPGTPTRGRTDLERVRRTTDEEIRAQIAEDPELAPEIDESWVEDAEVVQPATKEGVFIRLDPRVLAYFKQRGKGYQTRINAVLRSYVEHRLAQESPESQATSRPSIRTRTTSAAETLRRPANV